MSARARRIQYNIPAAKAGDGMHMRVIGATILLIAACVCYIASLSVDIG
ncbi:hypothetical protein [Cohnella sp. GCM10027633]